MIIKTTGRKRTANSYKRLINYIAGGGDAEKTLYTNCRNVDLLLNETPEIIKEMDALSRSNVRAKESLYHGVLSWREGEIPTKEQTEEAVDIYLKELGLENCVCYYGVHRNTNNIHLHVCVNRIDPVTGKAIQPGGGFDFKANERAARKIELAQGWEVENTGVHYEVVDGEIYEKSTKRSVPRLSETAKRIEELTSAKSAERTAQELCSSVLFNSKDWQSLHKELAKVGCRIEKKGSGGILFVGDVAVKLSKVSQKLSFKKMEARLGTFEEAKEHLEVKEIKGEEQNSVVALSSVEYLKERKQYYKEKSEAEDALKGVFQKEFKELKERQKKERDELYRSRASWRGYGDLLNALRSRLAYKQMQEKREWKRSKSLRRAKLKEQFKYSFPTYEKWLVLHNKKRESVLWRYRNSVQGIITGDFDAGVTRREDLTDKYFTESLRVGRDEKGRRAYVLLYRNKDNKLSFADRGRRIDVFDWRNEDALTDALELAAQKWGSITINGSEEYISRCIDVAVKNGIKVANPELQERIKERRGELFGHEKKEEKETGKMLNEPRAKEYKTIEEGLAAYDVAVGADRYRITAFYTGRDGSPRAFVFDKGKGSASPSRGYTFEELKKEIQKIEREDKSGKNIYITPISEKTHHILIDDLTPEKLRKLINDGYKPAAVMESSKDNFQALINIPKLHERLDKEISNLLMKRLNNEYGDQNIQGAVHPHRVAGTHNQKQKRTLPDGTQPVVRLAYAANKKEFCQKTAQEASKILKELLEEEKKRREAVRQNEYIRLKNRGDKAVTPYEAYMAHAADILNFRPGAERNLSVVDSMVAVRMYVTGWSVSEIESAIEAGAKDIRGEKDKTKHFWPDYAKRTASYPLTFRGSRAVAENKNKERVWRKLEGKDVESELER